MHTYIYIYIDKTQLEIMGYIYTRVKGSVNFTPGSISLKISIFHFQNMGVEPKIGGFYPQNGR